MRQVSNYSNQGPIRGVLFQIHTPIGFFTFHVATALQSIEITMMTKKTKSYYRTLMFILNRVVIPVYRNTGIPDPFLAQIPDRYLQYNTGIPEYVFRDFQPKKSPKNVEKMVKIDENGQKC